MGPAPLVAWGVCLPGIRGLGGHRCGVPEGESLCHHDRAADAHVNREDEHGGTCPPGGASAIKSY